MQESKTVVSIIDETIGLAADPVDTGVNILCPIISPNGPVKLTKVTGPTQLRSLYNAGASITSDSEQSLKYARALSAKSPLYIKRASRNLLKGGVTFGRYPSTFYTDQYGNVIDGQEVKFSLSLPAEKEYSKLLKSITDSTMSYIKMSDTVFVAASGFMTDSNALHKSTVDFDAEHILVIDSSKETLNGDVTIEISGSSYTIPSGTTKDKIESFLTTMCGAQSPNQPIGIYGTKVVYDTTIEGSTTKKRLTFNNGYTLTQVAFGNEFKIKYDNDADNKTIYKKGAKDTSSEITTADKLYIYTIYTKNEYEGAYIPSDIDFKLKFDAGTGDEVIHVISAGKNSDTTDNYVIEVPAKTTYDNMLAYLAEQINVYTTTDVSGYDSFIIVNGTTTSDDNPESTTEDVSIAVTNLSKPGLDEFGIVSKFPNAGKAITVSLTAANNDKYHTKEISVSYAGTTEDWTFSLDAGAVDGYGNDIGYKRINQDSDFIEIIPIGGTSSKVQTISIGNEITSDHIGVSGLVAALKYIQEYEESPVNFDYIVDGGVVDATYSSAIISACEVYQSFYPMSCQTTKVTKANLKNNRNRLGSTETFRANFIGAVQNEAILDSGIDTFPGSYYYLSKRLSLANTVREFAPLFGITEGDIGISSPAVEFKKSEREELLDSQVMTLRRSMTTGSYYLNDDLTVQKTDSYLQETSTVLMVNTINHVAMNYAETLKGQFNTAELRSKVVNALTSFISTRLRVGTQNGPDSITVVCDSTNNPQSLINQRKLRIDIYGRFNRSIKDVLIYTHVQPLEE